MVRVCGVVLEPNKHINIALQNIYGIGRTRAYKICGELEINPAQKVKDIEESIFASIQKSIEAMGFEIEGDLRRRISLNIKRLKDIKCYRGNRHRLGLPVRGQNTKTNAKTCKKRRGSSKK
jgi:small subunit ribosomal protein S13